MKLISAGINNRFKAEVDPKKLEDKMLKESCTEFESIYIEMMLKSMRDTLDDDIIGGGLSKDIYQSMYDQELSKEIAHGRNNFGLGDSLYRQLQKADPEKK